MNYTQYLEDGGATQERLFSPEEVEMIKKLLPYGEAFKQNPLAAIQMASEDPEMHINIQNDAEIMDFLAGLQSYGQLVGDNDLVNDIAQFGQKVQSGELIPQEKCGGRVRAKVKKACGGKKLEKGSKVPEVKKGGCPCQWKKVGGRLIEVDCNGIPVAKNGAVLFAKLGDGLHPVNAQLDVNPNLFGGTNYRSQYLWGNGGNNTTIKVPIKSSDTPEQSKGASYYIPQGKMAASKFIYDVMRKPSRDNTWTYMSERVLQGLAPVSETVLNEIETGKVTGKSPREVDQREAALLAEEMRRVQEFEAAQAAARERNAFGAGKRGKFGGLTYDEALARQREMQAAKDQGFTVDLGRWGADGKWGNQSRGEWERYQQWKAAQGAQPEMSAGEKFVKEGYNSGRPWQDAELQNMDADQAIHLKTPDYNRWMSLNFNQTTAKPYVAPVLNPNAVRKDYPTGIAPYTGVNPIVAARKDGGKMPYADYLK